MDETTDRWADADARARGFIDPQRPVFEPRSRRRRRLTTIVSIVVGLALGVVLFLTGQAATTGDPGARGVPAAVIFGVGIVIWIVGSIWSRRTGRTVRASQAIAAPLTDGERRDLNNQITGKAPVDVERLPTIVAMADQQRAVITGQTPRIIAAALMGFALLVAGISPALTVLAAVVTGCAAFVIVRLALHLTHVRRFLEQHAR